MSTDPIKQMPHIVGEEDEKAAMPIAKPESFNLDDFKSSSATVNVETLLPGLPHYKIADAKDYVRLHPDEKTYWSDELCFVSVPIQGQRKDSLHLIVPALAREYLAGARLVHHRLALATKPFDKFFLCEVPTRHLDNVWNKTSLAACRSAQTVWTKANRHEDEAVEGYVIYPARHVEAFPNPRWPSLSLSKLIEDAFSGRIINSADHAGLLRLLGAKL
jgi:hypothetical protein